MLKKCKSLRLEIFCITFSWTNRHLQKFTINN